MKPKVSIIYVYYNTPIEIVDAVKSVHLSAQKIPYEIIIVDNNSPKLLPNVLKKNKQITIIHNKENKGFGKAVNQAANIAKGKYLLITNPDSYFIKDAILQMYKKIESDKSIGLLGPQQLSQDKTILQSINEMPKLPKALIALSLLSKLFPKNSSVNSYWMFQTDKQQIHNVEVIGGACMLLEKKTFYKIGGFDERFFMYFEEADLSYRVRQLGLHVVYFPKAKIVHYIGRSSANKTSIQKIFEKSRFLFFQKYQGNAAALFAEIVFRLLQPHVLILLCILGISTFLNVYRISTEMMFFGDFGRDYLAARDILIYHSVPLVGITSSVTWLHQGPLSVYLIALALWIGNFSPYAPAILYCLMGVATTYFVYKLGTLVENRNVGLLSAAFYATSPLIVVYTRQPYHTAIIPFFATLFFITIYKMLQGKRKYIPVSGFLLGMLMLLELSNIVLFAVLAILFILYKLHLSKKDAGIGLIAFFLGILPFVLYEFENRFSHIKKLLQVIAKHIQHTSSNNFQTKEAILFIWQQTERLLFPNFHIIAIAFVLGFILFSFYKRKEIINRSNKGLIMVLLWLFIPLIIYTLRSVPGPAYFPLLFPAFALLVGMMTSYYINKQRLVLIPFIALIIWNSNYLISNHYFLDSAEFHGSSAAGWNYGLGLALSEQEKLAQAIANDAGDKSIKVVGEGKTFYFPSDMDNYLYLIWYYQRHLDNNAMTTYVIAPTTTIKKRQQIIYSSNFLVVKKYE